MAREDCQEVVRQGLNFRNCILGVCVLGGGLGKGGKSKVKCLPLFQRSQAQENGRSWTGAPQESYTDKYDVNPIVLGQIFKFIFQLLSSSELLEGSLRLQGRCGGKALEKNVSYFVRGRPYDIFLRLFVITMVIIARFRCIPLIALTKFLIGSWDRVNTVFLDLLSALHRNKNFERREKSFILIVLSVVRRWALSLFRKGIMSMIKLLA